MASAATTPTTAFSAAQNITNVTDTAGPTAGPDAVQTAILAVVVVALVLAGCLYLVRRGQR